jgi:2-dehydro-3-deoxyphosphogluconate aldolase/(4S)-4-hydroxy-2-oxoglutarate aldolase
VLGVAQADAGIAAGAQFVVTPILRPEVVALCRARAVPVVCGASTPTEVVAAHEAGADFVKVFPSRLGGPGYFRDLLAPMPWLRLVAVGGVSVANAGDYLAAGATAVGIGASLVPADAVEAGDFARITAAARSLCLLAAGSPWPSAARGLES